MEKCITQIHTGYTPVHNTGRDSVIYLTQSLIYINTNTYTHPQLVTSTVDMHTYTHLTYFDTDTDTDTDTHTHTHIHTMLVVANLVYFCVLKLKRENKQRQMDGNDFCAFLKNSKTLLFIGSFKKIAHNIVTQKSSIQFNSLFQFTQSNTILYCLSNYLCHMLFNNKIN